MHPVGRSNRGHIMDKIKMYNTSLTTMDAELFKQIKILAAKLNKHQNDLLEEAAKDLIKKYKNQKPAMIVSNAWIFYKELWISAHRFLCNSKTFWYLQVRHERTFNIKCA